MRIDEEAFKKSWEKSGIGDKTCRKIIEAYEQAKPRSAIDEDAVKIAFDKLNARISNGDFSGGLRLTIEEYEQAKNMGEVASVGAKPLTEAHIGTSPTSPANNMADASTRKDEGIQGNCASENTSSAANTAATSSIHSLNTSLPNVQKTPENEYNNTALVKKLVEALERIATHKHINPDGSLNAAVAYSAYVAKEALTEAQAWLERQGKCGEGWQPIETAPKDGIRYLGMIVGDRFYGEPFVCYYDEDEGHICLHQTEARLHRPTHWMPLPKPPTTSQQEARE